MTIYVGNIPYSMKETEIQKLFSDFGNVVSVKVITDKFTKRSKGYAFVEMEDDSQAQSAIDALNGSEVQGRSLKVSKANPRKEPK